MQPTTVVVLESVWFSPPELLTLCAIVHIAGSSSIELSRMILLMVISPLNGVVLQTNGVVPRALTIYLQQL
jgi:hypothetical protein